MAREIRILDAVHETREQDPGIGGVKLWLMLCVLFNTGWMPGRDSFLNLLRRHGLMQKPRKSRSTTNSNHRFHKWKNLIKGFKPMAANQLWQSDITYIDLAAGQTLNNYDKTSSKSPVPYLWFSRPIHTFFSCLPIRPSVCIP